MQMLLRLSALCAVLCVAQACFGDTTVSGDSDYDYIGNYQGGDDSLDDGRSSGDGGSVCDEAGLHEIVDEQIAANPESPKDAAVAIQDAAEAKYGGKFEAIVSDCDFAYANFYMGDCWVKTQPASDQIVLAWKNKNN